LIALRRALGSWLGGGLSALALLVLAGGWPTWRLGGRPAVLALAVGCGVGFVGSLIGALPVLVAVARGGAGKPHVTAGWAMALRSAVTLLGAALTAAGGSLPKTALLAWIALSYGALLVVETRWTLRWLRLGAA
jgi:hypothetical protein